MQPQPNQRWNFSPQNMPPRFHPRTPRQGHPRFWGPPPGSGGSQWGGGHPGTQLMQLEQFGTPTQQRFPNRHPPPRGPMHGPRTGPHSHPGAPPHHQGPTHGPRGPPRPTGQGHFQRAPFPPQNQGKKQQKKAKVDKRDLPENNKFYCDTCDRGYKDEDKYELHMKEHKKCPHDGCSYVAAARLVTLHVKLQHNSGMAKKIWSLESQEDIQKWREDRRRNFPTAENIAKKKVIIEEKIARGEVIEEKYFGKMRHKGQGRGRGRGRGSWQSQSSDRAEVGTKHKLSEGSEEIQSCPSKQMKTESASDKKQTDDVNKLSETPAAVTATDTTSLCAFFQVGSSSSSSDSDSDEPSTPLATPLAKPTVTAAGALGSLITAYSDSEEEEDEEVKPTSDKAKPLPKPSEPSHSNNNNVSNIKGNNKGNKNRQRTRARKGNTKYPEYKLDKSLLEKLLAKEIRHERNKIMQCVHYIVKHNFLDDTST